MKKISLKLASLTIVGAVALPFLALAQPVLPNKVTTYGDVVTLIGTIGRWIFGILIAVAVIYILLAAYKYLTAAGDAEKIKSANHNLIYAAVAVAIGILALGIPQLVGNLFGVSVTPFQ